MEKDKERLFYIGFYGDEQSYSEGRHVVPAGANKMDYIAYAMSEAGLNVEIISPAWLKYDKIKGYKFIKQRRIAVYENVNGILSPSFTLPFRALKLLTVLFSKLWLILYIICNVRRHDKVVVYHSPFYLNCIYWLKRIIGFKLVLEVEEIYTYAFSLNHSYLKKELKLIRAADKYILVNDLIGEFFDINEADTIVCYGSYKISSANSAIKFNDSKIHLVYAGSLGKYKGGAQNAIQSAKYLSNKYAMHILGVAEGENRRRILNEIEEINSISDCKVKYEGCKLGDEYASFMQGCDIGLNPQTWGDYMLYAYPSKTLSYLCFRLNVVTSPLKTLKVSKLNDLFFYTEQDTPESIAQAIMQIDDFDKDRPVAKIVELHSEFIADLKILFD